MSEDTKNKLFAEDVEEKENIEGVAENAMKEEVTEGIAENAMQEEAVEGIAENAMQEEAVEGIAENAMQEEATEGVAENAMKEEATEGVAKNAMQEEVTEGIAENAIQEEATEAVVEHATGDNTSKKLIDDFSLMKNVTISECECTVAQTVSLAFSKKIVNRSIVLAVAILLFSLIFTPFAKYDMETLGRDDSITIAFSPKDCVELAVRSAVFLDDVSITETDIYKKMVLAQEEGDLEEEELVKKNIMISAMNRNAPMRATVLVAAVVSVIYAILCLILLCIAIKDLIIELLLIKKKGKVKKRHASYAIICMIACLVPILMFSFSQAFDFGVYGVYTKGYEGFANELAWGAITCACFSVLSAIFACAVSFFEIAEHDTKIFTRERIRGIVCCILLVILIISVFLPIISINIWDQYGVIDELHVNMLDISEMSSADRALYRSIHKEYGDKLFENLELSEEIADDSLAKTLFHSIIYGRSNPGILSIFWILSVCATLIILGLLLYKLIKHTFFGSTRMGGIRTLKVLMVISITIDLFMAYIFLDLAQRCLYGRMLNIIEIKWGVSFALMIIFAMATILWRLKKKEKKSGQVLKSEYDAADVSYAPYAVDEIK